MPTINFTFLLYFQVRCLLDSTLLRFTWLPWLIYLRLTLLFYLYSWLSSFSFSSFSTILAHPRLPLLFFQFLLLILLSPINYQKRLDKLCSTKHREGVYFFVFLKYFFFYFFDLLLQLVLLLLLQELFGFPQTHIIILTKELSNNLNN